MKKIILLAIIVTTFASCTKESFEEETANMLAGKTYKLESSVGDCFMSFANDTLVRMIPAIGNTYERRFDIVESKRFGTEIVIDDYTIVDKKNYYLVNIDTIWLRSKNDDTHKWQDYYYVREK